MSDKLAIGSDAPVGAPPLAGDGPSARQPAEALRFDPKRVIEPAAEVLEGDVGGQFHQSIRREVLPQRGKYGIIGIPAGDRDRVRVPEYEPLERCEDIARGIVGEMRKLRVVDAGRLA
jgi:hypothetical protein